MRSDTEEKQLTASNRLTSARDEKRRDLNAVSTLLTKAEKLVRRALEEPAEGHSRLQRMERTALRTSVGAQARGRQLDDPVELFAGALQFLRHDRRVTVNNEELKLMLRPSLMLTRISVVEDRYEKNRG
jgi:histone H3/H4